MTNSESSSGEVEESDDDLVIVSEQDILDFNNENILPQTQEAISEIREWLHPTKYDGDGSEYQKHIASHHAGTGEWVFKSQIYQEWHDSREHGTLLVRGLSSFLITCPRAK